MYFVIRNSDGDTTVERVTKEELERRLNDHYYGGHVLFLKGIDNRDTNYWPESGLLIIKGEIVVPRAVEVVTRSELP